MILVTGGTGQLGTAIRSLLSDAVYPTREHLDLALPDSVDTAVAEFRPDAIVNCAAYTAVDRADPDESTAYAVNAASVGVLAAHAARRAIPFVTVSTDYVFDGSATTPYVESSATGPLNAYGRTKLAGEAAALTAYPDTLVVRTSWVFSATHDNFVAATLRRAAAGEALAVHDQRSAPTSASDLALSLIAALTAGVTGILHLTNGGDASRFELAVEALKLAGLDVDRVVAVDSAAFPDAVPRPEYSVMRSERLDSLGLSPMRSWREALVPVVGDLTGR
jgi:dTDP-4-dehydrorhamnose reductase